MSDWTSGTSAGSEPSGAQHRPLDDEAVDQLLRAAGAEGRRQVPASEPPAFAPSRPSRLPLAAAAAFVLIAGGWLFRAGIDRGQSVDQTIPVADGSTTSTSERSTPASTGGQTVTQAPTFVEMDFSTLLAGRESVPLTDLARPEAGETVTDPAFNNISMTRITPQHGDEFTFVADVGAGHAFNADGSLILLRQVSANGNTTAGYSLVDAESASVINPPLDLPPAATWDLTWSPQDPNMLLYTEGNELKQLNVATRESRTIRLFADCNGVRTDGGSISWDGDVVLLQCDSGDGDVLVAYRLSSDEFVTRPVDGTQSFLRVAPSGERFVVGDSTGAAVLDADLQPTGVSFERTSRATLTQTLDGSDVLIQPDYVTNLAGNLVLLDLETGETSPLAGPDFGGFAYVSGLTTATSPVLGGSGRVVVTGGSRTADALNGEIYIVDFSSETPQIGRLGHHRLSSPRGDDVDDLVAALSPSGTKVLFHSDWGEGGQIDAYIIDLG